jgi:RHS repeat-associated protein
MLSGEMHWENQEATGQESYGRFLYNRFRTYDPAIGRYISAEPLLTNPHFLKAAPAAARLKSLPYAYAVNNPQAHIDPDGHFARTVYHFVKNLFELVGYTDDPGIDEPGPTHDKYHHCVANCEATRDPLPGGEVAAWALDTAKEEGWDQCRAATTGGSSGPDPEDWDANYRGLSAPPETSCSDWCAAAYSNSGH